jgi:uncharacterized membrane protein (TIGR02234 family)
MTEQVHRPRGGFGPTLLSGLGGAVLGAVAGTQRWATARGDAAGVDVTGSVDGSTSAPLVVALALVALAAWGVVLVVRGRARRLVAGVGALAAAGMLVATVVALGRTQDDAVDAAIARGATGDAFASSLTGWYYATLVGGGLTLLAFAVAVLRSPGWPAMGSRYDAPSARPAVAVDAETGEKELWRALDEGHDPTA